MAAQPIQAIKIFYCYAREDDALRERLARHLSSHPLLAPLQLAVPEVEARQKIQAQIRKVIAHRDAPYHRFKTLSLVESQVE